MVQTLGTSTFSVKGSAENIGLHPSDHSINQEIFHDSKVDSKAGEKPSTKVNTSGQNSTKQKPQSRLKSHLIKVESATKALCYL